MVDFMTAGWADQCKAAINSWPTPEHKATKLQDFWDWIDMVRPFVTGRVVLAVRDRPPGAEGDALVLDFDGGTVVTAAVADRADVAEGATFLLAGDYRDWQDLLAGYDVGKVIMYRRLVLEKGETLQFFMAAFFWTEMLAAMQTIEVRTVEVQTAQSA